MSTLELCLYFVCHLLWKYSLSLLLVGLLQVLFVHSQIEFLDDDLGVTKPRKLITKNFPVIQMYSMCVKRQAFVAVQHGTRTWNHCRLIGNVRQPSTIIWFHFLKISRITHRIFCSCICCNLEMSCWIVSWSSLNVCTETSSTRTCAILISPISCIFRNRVSRRTFSFIDNSSCWRTCSRRDSAYPCCASWNSNLWA